MGNDLATRQPNGHFRAGAPSANPKGRPRTGHAFGEAVRAKLDRRTMDELIDVALAIALGEPMYHDVEWCRARAKARREGLEPPPAPERGEVVFPTVAEQLKAKEFLVSWGFMKPAVQVDLTQTSEARIDYSKLPDSVLEALEQAPLLSDGDGSEKDPHR